MGQIKVLFWFDVEDFINPESEEALLAILELLDRRGLVGIFKLVGEKIRMLEAHGRTDIIERLKRHEIGYHTNLHSVHPVVTEYLEPCGFAEGAAEFERREGSGYHDLNRITGVASDCYGQPGLAWAPQVYPVLRHWGIQAYLDVHNQITLAHRPFWYGGLLNLTSLKGAMSLPLREGGLEKAIQDFDRLCAEQAGEEIGIISLFYHPTEFVFSEFWDGVNFAKGNNPPPDQWVKPPFRPDGEMKRLLSRVEQFVDYTLSKENVEYIGTNQLVQLEQSEQRRLTNYEVMQLALQVDHELSYVVEGNLSLSASELFWIFRQHLLDGDTTPVMVYGPEVGLASDPLAGRCKVADLLASLESPLPKVYGYQQLPDTFQVKEYRVSPVDMTCTLASIVRHKLGPEDEVELVRGRLAAADHASDGEWAKHWVIFPENLKVQHIVELSKLQTWTLKPALL